MVMINRRAQENRYHGDALDRLSRMLKTYIPDWYSQAACSKADPATFWPDEYNTDPNKKRPGNGWTLQAQQVCAGCPVKRECADFSQTHDVSDGAVWAGQVRRAPGGTARGGYPDQGYAQSPDAYKATPPPGNRLSIEELLEMRDDIISGL